MNQERTAEIDAPVPPDQQVGCALWKCYRSAVYGIGDGSVTWWTIQPIERRWWLDAADNFLDALTVNPDLATRVIPPAECDHQYPPANSDGTCPACGKTRVIPPQRSGS